MKLSFITEPCSPESPAGRDLNGSAQWLELEQMQISNTDGFSEGIWSVSTPETDWENVEQHCVELLEAASKDLQILVWWVRARWMTNGLEGLQAGFEGLLCWISHWWVLGYPQDPQHNQAIKLGRLRWLDQQLSGLMEVQYQPSPSDEECAERIRSLINEIQAGLQADSSQAWGLFAKTLEKLPVRTPRDVQRTARPPAGHTALKPPQTSLPANNPFQSLQMPADRRYAVQSMEQALLYFEHHEPQHPVRAMLQRAVAWMNKPMDEWLSELVSDEASRKKIQDVLGLNLRPGTPREH